MRPMLAFALVPHAGACYFAQPVNIISLYSQLRLDVAAHILRPRLCTECTELQLELLARETGVLNGIRQIQRIRGRAAKHRRTEIVHQCNLFLRIAAGHRNDGCTDILGTGMRTQSAGKEPVSVGYLENVRAARTVCRKSTRQAFRPYRQVFTCIPHHGRFPRCSGRCVNTDYLTHGNGTKPERIIVAKVVFGGKRKFHDIIDAVDVIGGNAQFLHFPAIERSVMIHTLHCLFKTNALDFTKTFAVHAFDTLVPNHVFVVLH